MKNNIITVTRPLTPPLDEYTAYLKEIWKSKQFTNNGIQHDLLEKELRTFLNVPYISLFTNGTLALICGLKALNISGEVITTPYTFVATAHSLLWCNIKPVFIDIDPYTCNISTRQIKSAITSRTSAILPVHVYGNPCETEKIQSVANSYNLKVIYDAAHAFGVEVNNRSLLTEGDLSVISLNATKVFGTVEGGAIICHSKEMKERIDRLRSFGFISETEISETGINGKMDELRAAYGLAGLKYINHTIEKRKQITIQYRNAFRNIPGLSGLYDFPGIKHNYSYFPLFIDPHRYKMSRDELFIKMRNEQILCRKYFYPLLSSLPMYQHLHSANQNNLPVAYRKAKEVLCLPLHQELTEKEVKKVIDSVLL